MWMGDSFVRGFAYTCVFTCMYACMNVCMYAYMHTFIFLGNVFFGVGV